MKSVLLFLSFLALSVPALADTRSSNGDKATKERNTSPSASQKQEEEHAEAHSQPDSPTAKAAKPKSKAAKKPSASAGSSRPTLDSSQELAFKKHDLDGDGEISKAEAAGTDLISHFERFDRNRDGKLSRAEYARAMSAAAKRQAAR